MQFLPVFLKHPPPPHHVGRSPFDLNNGAVLMKMFQGVHTGAQLYVRYCLCAFWQLYREPDTIYRGPPSLHTCNNFFENFYFVFCPKVKQGPLSVPGFYFMFNIWQDAGIRTRVAATAAKCATNELHTSQNFKQ